VGRRPPSGAAPVTQAPNGTRARTGAAAPVVGSRTSMTGAERAYSAHSPAGSAPPRSGPHRAWSISPHTCWRCDAQPVARPAASGEQAETATSTGPSWWASATRRLHPLRGPASRFTCSDAVPVIIAVPASAQPTAAKCSSIAV
jgi:hypothetical protein